MSNRIGTEWRGVGSRGSVGVVRMKLEWRRLFETSPRIVVPNRSSPFRYGMSAAFRSCEEPLA